MRIMERSQPTNAIFGTALTISSNRPNATTRRNDADSVVIGDNVIPVAVNSKAYRLIEARYGVLPIR